MRVDQAGQEVAALEVDSPDTFSHIRCALGNGGYFSAANADGYTGPRLGPGAVHKRRVDQVEVLGLDRERGQQDEACGQGSKEHARGPLEAVGAQNTRSR